MMLHGMQFPDKCPENCKYKDDISRYGQNSICFRCPVLVCEYDPNLKLRRIEIADYRKDWAYVWYRFFYDGVEPDLQIFKER
jgi:hypothetical protein